MWDVLRSRMCCPWLAGHVEGSRCTGSSVFVLPRLPGTACAMARLGAIMAQYILPAS